MLSFPYKFCLITDFRFIPDNKIESILRQAIKGGVDLIQYRDKMASVEIRRRRLYVIRKITEEQGAGLIINGDIDLVNEIGADGIHLGQGYLNPKTARKIVDPRILIGVSIHNTRELMEADEHGADYLILSPLFSPGSKNSSIPPLGLEKFSELCEMTDRPALALGGINESNAHLPMQQGAWGVACITGLLQSDNIYAAAQKIKHTLSSYVKI